MRSSPFPTRAAHSPPAVCFFVFKPTDAFASRLSIFYQRLLSQSSPCRRIAHALAPQASPPQPEQARQLRASFILSRRRMPYERRLSRVQLLQCVEHIGKLLLRWTYRRARHDVATRSVRSTVYDPPCAVREAFETVITISSTNVAHSVCP